MHTAAIIGLGQIGLMYDFDPKRKQPSSHVLSYAQNPRIHLSATADVRETQEAYLKQLSPVTEYYQSVEAMLENNRCDIVSICTPPAFHLSNIKSILAVYTPQIIFCEKPIASNLQEVEEIYELLRGKSCLIVPNLTRRWYHGMIELKHAIEAGAYGSMNKIHIRYTRGLYNTGAHLFDLINWFAGIIDRVSAVERVATSSEESGDVSYSFLFNTSNKVTGYAEAYDDRDYYLFELDLYFDQGKIEIRDSGDVVHYYKSGSHRLFSGFASLNLLHTASDLLNDSSIANAVKHLTHILEGKEEPACSLADGIYPLFVAEAVLASAKSGQWEKVKVLRFE
jgi:predicted dehydrogenase